MNFFSSLYQNSDNVLNDKSKKIDSKLFFQSKINTAKVNQFASITFHENGTVEEVDISLAENAEELAWEFNGAHVTDFLCKNKNGETVSKKAWNRVLLGERIVKNFYLKLEDGFIKLPYAYLERLNTRNGVKVRLKIFPK